MAQLRVEDLPAHLARGVGPLYVVHGDEPLLALEAGDAIRAAARKAGCADREVLVAERYFDWDTFLGANANMGLFGDRKLIDLRIPSGKPGVDGAKALERYAAAPSPDNVTLITLPRLDRAAQSSAWFAALERAGTSVAVYPVERDARCCWRASRAAIQPGNASSSTGYTATVTPTSASAVNHAEFCVARSSRGSVTSVTLSGLGLAA